MKKQLYFLLFVSLFFCTQTSFAQKNPPCDCSTDVAFLHKKFKKTPAYKRNATLYKAMYPKIVEKAKNVTTNFDCLVLVNKLSLTLNDNHIKIYGSESEIVYKELKDPVVLEKVKKSATFLAYPKPKMDLDSLENSLSKKSFNAIEGIYYRKNYVTLGCFFEKKENLYHCVILSSELPLWERGEIMYTMMPYGTNFLRVVGGNLLDKRIISYTERIHKGTFLTMRFQKDESKQNHSFALHPKETYKREELNDETTYLKIGSFNSFYPTLRDAEKFYKTLENSLSKKYLIIDLRDNTGGGDRNSDIFFKIVKKYIKKHKVYVLVNHRTGSNAEQFTYKLSEYENCIILGDQTQGTASYEIKNSSYTTPANNYSATLTSKKHLQFISIESKGIKPEKMLSYDTAWIAQTINFIKNHE